MLMIYELNSDLTSLGINAAGSYFSSFCSSVCLFIRTSIRTKFWLKFLHWCISLQPLIGMHSDRAPDKRELRVFQHYFLEISIEN